MSCFSGNVTTTYGRTKATVCLAGVGLVVRSGWLACRPISVAGAPHIALHGERVLRLLGSGLTEWPEHYQGIDIAMFWVIEGLWQTADGLEAQRFP